LVYYEHDTCKRQYMLVFIKEVIKVTVNFDSHSALLITDMLNDFVEEGGTLVVPDARRIIPFLKEILMDARQQGVPVIFINDSHLEDDHEFRYWPAHAVTDTWGGEVIAELSPIPGEHIILKRRYSAFFETGLDMLLRELGVQIIYLAGVMTNVCVYSTAMDASMRDYDVVVFKDAVASLSEETDHFIFQQLKDVLQAALL
jgi:nicotinamidase/pyrazinamidase